MKEHYLLIVFLCHLAATWYMTGLIWFVQIVHYPLFGTVDESTFPAYEQRHTAWTTWAVGPPMLIEVATATLLVWMRPAGISTWQLWVGLVLLGIIWISTAFVQVPCHAILSQRYDPAAHERLVNTNWVRTFAWSARGVLLLWMLFDLLSASKAS